MYRDIGWETLNQTDSNQIETDPNITKINEKRK